MHLGSGAVADHAKVNVLRFVAFHHWAPVSIFPDWPWHLGAYLCVEHHREWHKTMREHGLRYPHELEAA